MADINMVMLAGRLTKDPAMTATPKGTAIAKFTVAANRMVKEGEHPQADFIRVVAWGKWAEACGARLHKGSGVCVKGRITTGSYDNKTTGQKVYTTEVTAEAILFTVSRKESEGESAGFQHEAAPAAGGGDAPYDPYPTMDEEGGKI